tara:strand:+ start:508 stop:669 length:162 start_codon:yes stop_codon:yes gene_type:complete
MFAIVLAILFSIAIAGCEQDGPAERTGEKIDSAIENTGEAIEDAGDKLEDTAR